MSIYLWLLIATFVLAAWSIWRWTVRERIRDAYRGGHEQRVTFEVQLAQGTPSPRALMRRVVTELYDEATSSDSKRRRGLGRVDFIEHLAVPEGSDIAQLRLYVQCDEAVADAVKREVKQHFLGHAATLAVAAERNPFISASERLRGAPATQPGAWGALHRARVRLGERAAQLRP